MSLDLISSRAGVASRRSAVGSLVALPIADALTMLVCFALGGLINFSYRNVTEERTLILVLLGAACLPSSITSATTAAGDSSGRSSAISRAWLRWQLLFDFALLYMLKVNFSRLWVLTSWVLVVPAIPLTRRLIKQVALELGGWLQPTVIIGTGPNAREIAGAYDGRSNHLGYQVQAFLDPAPAAPERAVRVGERDIPVVPLDPDARNCPAGSASRTWWWRSSSTRCWAGRR